MPVRVDLAPSGKSFTVEDGEKILAAALRQGVHLPYDCRNGTCGTCRARVTSGAVDYPEGRPAALTDRDLEQGNALLCSAVATGDLVLEAQEEDPAEALPVRTLPARVARREQLAHDVMRLWLKLPESQRLRFRAGQYVDILTKDGEKRAFSLANPPHDDALLELHVRHVPGGSFSRYVFSDLKEKALLRIQGPRGRFVLREASDRPMVFMAGGTGFAPIKGIIEHALAEGVRRDIWLYWGARARRDLYLDDLARGWEAEHANVHYRPVLSEPDAEDAWEGRRGFVHEAVVADFPDLSGFDVYASGPPVMVNAGRDAFVAHGLPPEHMYSDAFEYAHAAASR
jgi:CDP-4-dehydro-6-deoxyglucose reductase